MAIAAIGRRNDEQQLSTVFLFDHGARPAGAL
jgi:hypothetical protein